MPALPLRTDFNAKSCRLAASNAGEAAQTRRLLSIAAIYEDAGRSEPAALGSVTVQIVCDWVKKFNAQGDSADARPRLELDERGVQVGDTPAGAKHRSMSAE